MYQFLAYSSDPPANQPPPNLHSQLPQHGLSRSNLSPWQQSPHFSSTSLHHSIAAVPNSHILSALESSALCYSQVRHPLHQIHHSPLPHEQTGEIIDLSTDSLSLSLNVKNQYGKRRGTDDVADSSRSTLWRHVTGLEKKGNGSQDNDIQDNDSHQIQASYTCVLYAERFSDKEERDRHIKRSHERTFLCNLCCKLFNRKHDRGSHVSIVHERRRDFKCNLCQAAFGRKHHLAWRKIDVHLKGKSFSCDLCTSKFARREHLSSHQRIAHDKNKDYMCLLCDLDFYEPKDLQRQLEQIHSVKSSRAPLFVDWQPKGNVSAPSIKHIFQL